MSKHILAIEYHVYIWQVSPQLSCGDTCQIWIWFKESKGYLCNLKNFACEKLTNRYSVTPTPVLDADEMLCVWYLVIAKIFLFLPSIPFKILSINIRANNTIILRFWCAILIAHQIVMAKHGGSCVHFSGISTCGRTSRETVSHPQCPPLPTLCKISLPIYVIVTNKLLQPLTTTWYDSLGLSISLLKI